MLAERLKSFHNSKSPTRNVRLKSNKVNNFLTNPKSAIPNPKSNHSHSIVLGGFDEIS